jgi:excisionase family DNA binding protein
MSRLLTVARVAELCSCSEVTVRRAIRKGLLVARRVGRGVRIPEEAVAEWTRSDHSGSLRTTQDT